MTGDGDGNGDGGRPPVRRPGREADSRPLPRRFYKTVTIGPAPDGAGHAVLLDGRGALTPGRRPLALPVVGLAEAVAGEWGVQAATIDPARMPLTRLVNTALDGVAARQPDVAADIVKYAGSDLVCYRADHPEGLVARQRAHWDPVLAWGQARLGTRFVVTTGLMPVDQPPETQAAVAEAVGRLDVWRLTALHVMTTLMGSALLALAVTDRHVTPEAAWAAAHVDEDWQIAEWGEDAEATARRAARWQDMRAAATLAALLA